MLTSTLSRCRLGLRSLPRSFCAHAAPAAPVAADPSQTILTNALRHVQASGWTIEALGQGAQDAGFPSIAHGMFPRGPIELVEFFMDDWQRQVQDALAAEPVDGEFVPTDRLKRGVQIRLQLLAPYLHVWPQAMALELFMLTDTSPNREETWKFLDRRVEEAIALGEVPQNAGDIAGMVSIGLQSLLSTAAALAGPLSSQVVAQVAHQVPNPLSSLPTMTTPRPPTEPKP
ncbi:hypothetical protein SPRG_19696 [Saprolegnia parasitica CBS 223.65]|uniref:Ubiquinone biosynthesis protein n=1 Tax=Saprolegnia parasitica (strain CBS 223.65) TaxID=695850 RepID=A0A067CH32_SAPPC|nr:hypothetical protein SPRG_19696 [Saprolegnia parasitica CBS 223.65]KDO29793.1 hypothetical protein SPRG_19696 [Saprolegnia parasitica CBS 223.65]|eukprot:XP_012199520.1 hypothetical protein SPRG_19696 [Saprolegnia parasitica CBS 223.65]